MAYNFPIPAITDGGSVARTAKNTNYTLVASDVLVAQTDTTAAHTFTLPACSSVAPGKVYYIIDEGGNAATFNLTVSAAGGDTIEGSASYTINTNYGYVRLYNTGKGWFIW